MIMKDVKKILFCLIAFPVLMFFLWGMIAPDFSILTDPEVKLLEIVSWEEILPVKLNVPVRYVDKQWIFTKSSFIKTKDGERYSFRIDPEKENVFWITKLRCFLGGKYLVRYKITDPEVEKKLIELYKTNPIEVLLEQQTQKSTESGTIRNNK